MNNQLISSKESSQLCEVENLNEGDAVHDSIYEVTANILERAMKKIEEKGIVKFTSDLVADEAEIIFHHGSCHYPSYFSYPFSEEGYTSIPDSIRTKYSSYTKFLQRDGFYTDVMNMGKSDVVRLLNIRHSIRDYQESYMENIYFNDEKNDVFSDILLEARESMLAYINEESESNRLGTGEKTLPELVDAYRICVHDMHEVHHNIVEKIMNRKNIQDICDEKYLAGLKKLCYIGAYYMKELKGRYIDLVVGEYGKNYPDEINPLWKKLQESDNKLLIKLSGILPFKFLADKNGTCAQKNAKLMSLFSKRSHSQK